MSSGCNTVDRAVANGTTFTIVEKTKMMKKTPGMAKLKKPLFSQGKLLLALTICFSCNFSQMKMRSILHFQFSSIVFLLFHTLLFNTQVFVIEGSNTSVLLVFHDLAAPL